MYLTSHGTKENTCGENKQGKCSQQEYPGVYCELLPLIPMKKAFCQVCLKLSHNI